MDAVGIGNNIEDYCNTHDLRIVERFEGHPKDYPGKCKVIVWGGYPPMFEFYYLRLKFKRRGIDLLSVRDYGDLGQILDGFVSYLAEREIEERKAERKGGRQPFGFAWVDGKRIPKEDELEIARVVIEMRSSGYSLRKIVKRLELSGYSRNGKPIALSTVQNILKNKELY